VSDVTGTPITPVLGMQVLLDSPSIPLRWLTHPSAQSWRFLDIHDILVITACDADTVTFRAVRGPALVYGGASKDVDLTIPRSDFHTGYFTEK